MCDAYPSPNADRTLHYVKLDFGDTSQIIDHVYEPYNKLSQKSTNVFTAGVPLNELFQILVTLQQ